MGLKLTDLFSSVAALSKKQYQKKYQKNYEERRNETRAMIDCQPLLLPQLLLFLLLLSEPRRRSRSREKENSTWYLVLCCLQAALEKDANSQASSKCNDSHTQGGEGGRRESGRACRLTD